MNALNTVESRYDKLGLLEISVPF